MSLNTIANNILYDIPISEEVHSGGSGGSCQTGYCCYCHCGGCGGGGGSGDGCAIILLVGAIIALAVSFFISLAATIGEGSIAERRRHQAQMLDECGASEWKGKLMDFVKDEHKNASINTATLSVITAGLGLLTATAIMALYVFIAHKNRFFVPFEENLLKNLAIAGGSTVLGGALAAGIYHGIRSWDSHARKALVLELKSHFPEIKA